MKTLARIFSLVFLLMGLLPAVAMALPPDCEWEQGGCSYQAYFDGGGGADVVMICGSYVHTYSGSAGDCPVA